jgi:hypothetical protein
MSINKSSFQILSDKKCNIKPIQHISEFQDYIGYFESLFSSKYLWYRGVLNSSYQLIPSIYRDSIWHYNPTDEWDMTNAFIHKAKGYFKESSTIKKWEWYQIMQHHGLPTRLLDWTEGYLIALFFALTKYQADNTPAVWVLDPYSLNLNSTGHATIYYTDSITRESPLDDIVEKYISHYIDYPILPLALSPPYVNERMASQKSCFTVHGKNINGFEEIYKRNNDFSLIQLTIDPTKALMLKNDLYKMGITEATLFPDLEGLAREFRFFYGMKS